VVELVEQDVELVGNEDLDEMSDLVPLVAFSGTCHDQIQWVMKM